MNILIKSAILLSSVSLLHSQAWAANPYLNGYLQCLRDEAKAMTPSGESAETITLAARSACKVHLQRSLSHEMANGVTYNTAMSMRNMAEQRASEIVAEEVVKVRLKRNR